MWCHRCVGEGPGGGESPELLIPQAEGNVHLCPKTGSQVDITAPYRILFGLAWRYQARLVVAVCCLAFRRVAGIGKARLKKEKWTLTFDRRLKGAVMQEDKRRGVYPVQVLESLVREKFNPFGHADIKDEVAYVRKLRKKIRGKAIRNSLRKSAVGKESVVEPA